MRFYYLLPFISALIPTITSSPIEARTCPSTGIIQDGGFETTSPSPSGPWEVVGSIPASSGGLTSPGSTNAGGKYAFTATVYPGPYNPTSGITLRQTMKTCAGKNYSIIADIRFSESQNNLCSISLQYPYKNTIGSVTTGSATPGTTPGVWSRTAGTFQAVSSADVLSFVFRCQQSAHNLMSVDNVKVAPFSGNAY
ncbi:MAG: hypothetical protein Q9225_005524 [Loekoesia sp. 1 TL-2023]